MGIVRGIIFVVNVFLKLDKWYIYIVFWNNVLVCYIVGKIMVVVFYFLCKDCFRNLGRFEICFKEWNKIEFWIYWIAKDKYYVNF